MAEKFLAHLFKSLKENDFKHSKWLQSFYAQYKLEARSQRDKCMSLFEFYMEFITRSKQFDDPRNTVDQVRLCETIRDRIIGPEANTTKAVQYKRRHALDILSEFIEQSFVEVEQEEEITESVREQREELTNIIAAELHQLGIKLPVAMPDAINQQISRRLNIWNEINARCNEIYERATQSSEVSDRYSKLLQILQRVYLFTLTDIASASHIYSETIEQENVHVLDNESFKCTSLLLPCERFERRTASVAPLDPAQSVSSTSTSTTVKYYNYSPMRLLREISASKPLYICSGSHWTPGGNANQGFDSAESKLYLTSTYNIAIERACAAYPLKPFQVCYTPRIMVLSNENYMQMEPNDWYTVAVLMAPTTYMPATNLPQQEKTDVRMYDQRIFSKKAAMIDTTELEAQLTRYMAFAQFMDFSQVVIDDLSVTINTIPVYDAASVLRRVCEAATSLTVHVCCENAATYEIFAAATSNKV